MKVIIAEKPSLARNIVQAIDSKMKKKDGYYENEEYIVTYAFGHLFRLYDVEMYKEDYDSNKKYPWKMEDLPFFPHEFRFGLEKEEGIIKQFKIIRNLINQDNVESVINAGDSDREGEIIIRIILKYALKKNVPIKRLWMPDQTPKTILNELNNIRDDKDYDSLANEGYARTFVDWCYGINLTRYSTILSHTLLRVGRVIAPIVQEIYNREMAIINFKPEKYYVLNSKEKTNNEIVELTSKKEFNKDQLDLCKETAKQYNSLKAIVSNVNFETKTISPGKLYSLSKLQGELGKKYKMSLDQSLKIVQDLYEKGYVSYPRTPSQYLSENEKGKFKEIISQFQNLGVKIKFKDSKQIFDDSKIESHSALTPTYKIPKKSDLSEEEHKVYKAICNRFFSVFSQEPCLVNRTTIEIKLGEEEIFNITGDVVINKGWTVFEEREKKDKILPNLQIGDQVNIDFKVVEKETNPPKRYTVETFNNFLKNPFKEQLKNLSEKNDESEDDEEEIKAMFEGVELGTEATRSSIIQNAIKSNYISLKDNVYHLELNGKYYVETLNRIGVMLPKEKTAELGRSLKKVYRGEITIDQAIDITKEEIRKVIEKKDQVTLDRAPRVFEVEKSKILCKCPKCGNPIACLDSGYRCTYSLCGLYLYKDNKLFNALNRKLTKQMAKDIFTKGRIELTDLVSKNGNKYDAILVSDFSEKFVKFKFEFPKNDEKEKSSNE